MGSGQIAVNAAATAKSGYAVEEFLDMSLHDICPTNEGGGACATTRNPVRDHHLAERRSYLKRNGDLAEVIIYWQTSKYRKRDAMLAAVVEASGNARTEADRLHSLELLNAVVDNIPVVLFVKEPREHRYILVNRRCEQVLGIPRGELIGRTDEELFARDDAGVAAARDRNAFEGEGAQSRSKEMIWTRHNGARGIAIQRLAIPGGGARKYVLSVAEEIATPRRSGDGGVLHRIRDEFMDRLTNLPNHTGMRPEEFAFRHRLLNQRHG